MERMDPAGNVLGQFQGLSLEKLDDVKLLKRFDTKFVFHKDKLPFVFDYLYGKYGILEINKNRIFKYESLYYDTDDYIFYHMHHNKRLNRYKIRCRRYLESDQCFFEIKFKNNKSKTLKTRLRLEDRIINAVLSENKKEFVRTNVSNGFRDILAEIIKPKLWVEFDRITLANQVSRERFTFDSNLSYTDTKSRRHYFNNLVIAELKSESISPDSSLLQHLKSLKIFPTTFSKYCIGIATTNNNIKANRFKRTLLKLENFN
jgi:hypothetical protein